MKKTSKSAATSAAANPTNSAGAPATSNEPVAVEATSYASTVQVLVNYRSYKKSPGKLSSFATRIMNNMSNNPNFTGEGIDELLVRLGESYTTFSTSWADVKASHSVVKQNLMLGHLQTVITDLDPIATYVQANSQNDVNIALSSGFELRSSSNARPTPGVVENMKVNFDIKDRKVSLSCTSMGRGVSYVAYYMIEGTDEWIMAGMSTNSRRIPVSGLKQGVRYYLSLAACIGTKEGNKLLPGTLWIGQ